jgi:hypothetical protein
MEFYEILRQISKRPQMYFSEVNTLALESFLYGYLMGHTCSGNRELCNVCEFDEFHDWVKCRFSSDKTGISWRYLLLERFDDEKAFKKFFELAHEFQNRKFVIIAELLDKNLICRQSTGEDIKEVPINSKIQLGKYTADPGYWVKVIGPDVCNLSGFYNDLEFLENFLGISRSDWTIIDKDQFLGKGVCR